MCFRAFSVFFNNKWNNTTTTVQNEKEIKEEKKCKQKDKVHSGVSDSALQYSTVQYRSAVQQPDCLGEEAVTEAGSARFDALVALFGREYLEQGMGGMAGVFDDVTCFSLTARGVDVMKAR